MSKPVTAKPPKFVLLLAQDEVPSPDAARALSFICSNRRCAPYHEIDRFLVAPVRKPSALVPLSHAGLVALVLAGVHGGRGRPPH
jgi:hypothetical protein